MHYQEWISDGWSWFFASIAIAIFVTLTAPALFGLQNFTQWGGMYDDHWCHAEAYSSSPYHSPSPAFEELTAGNMGKSRVYSAPSHNKLSCLAWVKTLCGQKATDGWTIEWVEAKLKGELFLEKNNACDISLPGGDRWYFHANL